MQDPIRKQRLQSLFEILSEQLQYQHDGDLPHENFSPGDRYCTLESSQEGSCFWANSFKNLDEAATHITTLAFDGYWGVDAVIDLDQMELIEGSIHVKLAHKRHPPFQVDGTGLNLLPDANQQPAWLKRLLVAWRASNA